MLKTFAVDTFQNRPLAGQDSTNNVKTKDITTLYYDQEVTKVPYSVVSTL